MEIPTPRNGGFFPNLPHRGRGKKPKGEGIISISSIVERPQRRAFNTPNHGSLFAEGVMVAG